MEDKDIVNLIYNRDEIGLANLKEKYDNLIISIALAILKNNSDSEESASDTYLKIWKSIPPYKPNYLKSFISKITRQISIDKYRRNKKKYNEETSLNDLDYEISSSYNVDDTFYATELAKDINNFLEKLDVESQILFLRRYFLNEEVKSLSNRFNISENKISVKLHRTREKLRMYLERKGYKIAKG